jgi:threonine/homoserine/homoserine lactone efflux protein
MDGKLLAFLGISTILIITPGPDMAMVTKNALGHGRRGALFCTLGISTALLIHAGVAAVGLSALLRTASGAFMVVKLCGAAYLLLLGLWTLRTTHRNQLGPHGETSEAAPVATGGLSSYGQGFLSAILNPKLVVFFATFLPQFVEGGRPVLPQMLLLGVIFDLMGILWLTSYGLFVTRMHDLFSSAAVRRRMGRLTGAALVGLGLRLALERS